MAFTLGINHGAFAALQENDFAGVIEDSDHQPSLVCLHVIFKRSDVENLFAIFADMTGQIGRFNKIKFVMGAAGQTYKAEEQARYQRVKSHRHSSPLC